MNALRQPWGLIRIVRLVAGSIIIYQSMGEQQPILALLGALFVFQSLTNTGCGSGGCHVPQPANKANKEVESTEYEEVK